jgi:NAD-dependent dihydropyrimidine dehydrogenase PreA subunit
MREQPKTRGWVEIREDECKGCLLCLAVCPSGCLEIVDRWNRQGYHPVRYKGEGCLADGLCYYACPEPGAITVFRGERDERTED